MWFVVGALLIPAGIMLSALVGDTRRKAKPRRMNETSLGHSRPIGERTWTEQAVRSSSPLGQQGSVMNPGPRA